MGNTTSASVQLVRMKNILSISVCVNFHTNKQFICSIGLGDGTLQLLAKNVISIYLLLLQVGMFCQSSSVYLTVFISLERWVAVCRPLQAKHICTQFRWVRELTVFSAVKRSIGFTIGFHNHREGPY